VGMPLIRLEPGKPNQATSAERGKSVKTMINFCSFSYKRNGFASFATKRRKITYLTRFILFLVSNQQFRKSAEEFMNNPG